jgi:hypothetical protein
MEPVPAHQSSGFSGLDASWVSGSDLRDGSALAAHTGAKYWSFEKSYLQQVPTHTWFSTARAISGRGHVGGPYEPAAVVLHPNSPVWALLGNLVVVDRMGWSDVESGRNSWRP